jgi:hypothetical protein
MSVLDRLDATRLCARWSPQDEDVWARPIPVPVPERRVASAEPVRYSWRALVRNPLALVVTGMVGALVVLDAGARPFVRRQAAVRQASVRQAAVRQAAVRSRPADSRPLLAAST